MSCLGTLNLASSDRRALISLLTAAAASDVVGAVYVAVTENEAVSGVPLTLPVPVT
jgi:hypothetical protein